MKKFFIKSIFLGILIIISIILIILILSPIVRNDNDYVAATIDKEKRLQEIVSPKIILVGGSNLAFGINSKEINQAFNYPVENMSLHAGLGLQFMLNEAIVGVKKSDIVLLSTEYYLDKPDTKLLTQLIDANPNTKKYIKIDAKDLVSFYISDLQRCITSSIKVLGKNFSDNIYVRNGFTSEGDLISHLNKKNVPIPPSNLQVIDYSHNISLINSFIDAVNIKGGKVYFLFPTYQHTAFILNKKDIINFADSLSKKLKCKIINTPYTFVYNDNFYFNSEYHLDKEGRELRTKVLIDTLRDQVFNKRNPIE